MGSTEKKSRLSWVFFAIILPLVVLLVILGAILSFLGVSLGDEARNVGRSLPVISSFIKKEDPGVGPLQQKAQTEEYWKKKVNEARESIKRMEKDARLKEGEIKRLKDKIQTIEQPPATENLTEEKGGAEKERPKKAKKAAAWYNTMPPRNAAAILGKMEPKAALSILKELDDEVSGGILAEMEPDKAARLTTKMKED